MYHARNIVTAAESLTGEQQKELEALKTVDDATKVWAENWYDGLTYCKLTNFANDLLIRFTQFL
jgi:hypothetical protein